jgi:hypothetical protein
MYTRLIYVYKRSLSQEAYIYICTLNVHPKKYKYNLIFFLFSKVSDGTRRHQWHPLRWTADSDGQLLDGLGHVPLYVAHHEHGGQHDPC